MSRFKIVLYASAAASVAALLIAALLPEFIAGFDREDVTLQYLSAPPTPDQLGKPLTTPLGGFVILKKDGNNYFYYDAVHTGDARLAILGAVLVYWAGFGFYIWIRALRRRRPPEPLRRTHWRRSSRANS